MDFDLACSYRLEIYERDVQKANAQLTAYEVGKLFGGSESAEGSGQEETVVW